MRHSKRLKTHRNAEYYEIYKGNNHNDKRHGYGTMYEVINGDTTKLRPQYSGQWKNGEYHGHGKLYDYYGKKITYEGEFKNGEKVK